jgi:hypothetical protein
MSACVYLVFHGRHSPNGLFAFMAYSFEFLDVSVLGILFSVWSDVE